MKEIIVITLLASATLFTPFLIASSIKPVKPYGEVIIGYAVFGNGTLWIGVRSWGTGSPVKIDYVICVYDRGIKRMYMNITLEHYKSSVITINLDRMPRYIIVHYIDIWNNEERLAAIKVSRMLTSNEASKISFPWFPNPAKPYGDECPAR